MILYTSKLATVFFMLALFSLFSLIPLKYEYKENTVEVGVFELSGDSGELNFSLHEGECYLIVAGVSYFFVRGDAGEERPLLNIELVVSQNGRLNYKETKNMQYFGSRSSVGSRSERLLKFHRYCAVFGGDHIFRISNVDGKVFFTYENIYLYKLASDRYMRIYYWVFFVLFLSSLVVEVVVVSSILRRGLFCGLIFLSLVLKFM